MSKITDIKNIDSMISFLKDKGSNHEYYYHYTTWDSLSKILQFKTFLLTRGNSLSINDQHEVHMKGSWKEWNKIFIGSFAFGSSEIMAMWGLYGLPWWDAVRLCIPKDKMNEWINGIMGIKLFENGRDLDYRGDFDASLNDIVYVMGKKETDSLRLTHNTRSITVSKTCPLYGIDKSEKMTGYIKNHAWQYENEVRLRIRLAYDTCYEKISIIIPDEVVDSITITTGPYFKQKCDELQHRLIDENRIFKSGFENLLKYKELCEMCQYNFTKKK